MANVSEQVRQQDDFIEYFEALATLDDQAEIEQVEAELKADFDLIADLIESDLVNLQDNLQDQVDGFLPDFALLPAPSYFQDLELQKLNLVLAENPLVSVIGSNQPTGLVAKYCEGHPSVHKFWVAAPIYSFTEFGQWAIANLQLVTSDISIPDDRLIPTLVNLLTVNACVVVIDQLDFASSEQQEFWLDFLQAWQSNQAHVSSKIIVTSQATLELTPELALAPALSNSHSADLLMEMGILGDRQDLETFSQFLGGNPLALTLAAKLLKTEEQIPQIRYLARYGKIFDLNHPSDRRIAIKDVFDRTFKRLLPKLRDLLIIASIYTQPFSVKDIQAIYADQQPALDLVDLQKLEEFGLLRHLGQNHFGCEPQIKTLVPIADPKPYHEQLIKYFWSQTKPAIDWESDRDLSPYFAIFQHCCALGEYFRGFYIIHDDTDQCLDRYLQLQGKHFQRMSLLKPLLNVWRAIQLQRTEFGAVLIGLGDAYGAMHKYNVAGSLYQEWLGILVKRQDPVERNAKAQCLYKLAHTLFVQAAHNGSNQWSQILPYFQESLEIAVKSSDRPLELKNLLGLGNLYSQLQQYPQALEYYDRHLNLAKELKDTQSQIEGLPMMANAYKSLKQYPKALELYRMHLTLVPNLEYGHNQVLRANSLESLADTYQILEEYTEAKASYQECLDLGIEQPQQIITCLIGLGITSDRLGQFKEAITYYERAQIIDINSNYESQSLINLAHAHYALGQYLEAVSFYEKSLKLALTTSDRHLQAQSLIGLGNVQNSLAKFVEATELYEQAWEISKDIPTQQAIALGNLGNVYNTLGQYQEARELYKQSLAISKQVGNLAQQAHCLHSLGQVLDRMGYYPQALQFYQEWIELKKAMGDRSASLAALKRDHSSYLGQNSGVLANTKYAQAIEFHQQWIEVKRKMGDRLGEATSLGNLGNAFLAIGQYPQSIQAYQQCLDIARTISDRRSEASSLSGLGAAFFILGQYSEAIKFHERSLVIAQKIDDFVIQAKNSSNLGKAYYALGQYLQASDQYSHSLELIRKIGNRQGEANILGDLGNTNYALGKYVQAIDFYQQWLDIATEIGDRSQQGNALGGLGNSHNAKGQYTEAVEFYLQWLNIAQDIDDRRSYANALAGLGNAYNALGEYSRAIEFHQQSLKIQKENSDRFTDKGSWTNLLDSLEHLEQKALTPNPYVSIDVATTNQDDTAIQQLLEAGANSQDIKSRDFISQDYRKVSLKEKSNLKQKPPQKKQPQTKTDQSWLGSVFGWLTGKKP